ncbi:DHH family phosphoesterase [Mycoplasma sp. SG1]|uniref:DHH family phosphoesterase n=1 Tax=Mycoplasma sp. SG1 TaxID=2810348 RepID=UPI002025301A|nr:bifunctional oligoribonuclease/PAP phosphatase NrnA [Mycoplasma sp. SG1]URM52801.1 bifunctional oligoribonuclease/PAP phosphatase NrnA [Mycoplasma sp. SG1]
MVKFLTKETQIFKNVIENHDSIVLFTHVNPDGDAIGSLFGLFQYLKLNYPSKKIRYAIDKLSKEIISFFEFTDEYIFNPDKNNDSKFLAIVLDVNVKQRVKNYNYLALADKILVVDHHLKSEKENEINSDYLILFEKSIATSELLSFMIYNLHSENSEKHQINNKTAKSLFYGIITDSNRFLYKNTNSLTFFISYFLSSFNFNLNEVYQLIYNRHYNEISLMAYIQQNFLWEDTNFVSFFLDEKIYTKFNVPYSKAKNFSFVFNNITEIDFWVFWSIDPVTKLYSVSLRSKKTPIHKIALKFGGGGHELAAGVKLKSKPEVMSLIREIKKLC